MGYATNRKMFQAGYCIPRSMDWMFWPFGYKPPEAKVVENVREGDVIEFVAEQPTVTISERIIGRQFTITNGDAFMAALEKLGVVREKRK